jgi:hypothetical protein
MFNYDFLSFSVYSATSTTNCSGLPTLYIPNNSRNLYVAAYSNPNQMNTSSDWLPVIFCASTIGTPTQYQCNNDIITNSLFNQLCFIKLDIQIDYTNIGSIFNPQPVLSAVIFNYQGIVSEKLFKSFNFLSFMFIFIVKLLNYTIYFTCNGKCYF